MYLNFKASGKIHLNRTNYEGTFISRGVSTPNKYLVFLVLWSFDTRICAMHRLTVPTRQPPLLGNSVSRETCYFHEIL